MQASGEKVFCLAAEAPVAQAAEALMETWLARPVISLVLVPEVRNTAFLSALRSRISKLPLQEECSLGELASAVHRIADAGASLIVGGEDGHPALVANLKLNRQMLASLGRAAPMLMVGTLEENAADEDLFLDFCRTIPALGGTN